MCPDEFTLICRHLRGSREGAICQATGNFVRNVEDASIKMCMTRRFELCPTYVATLRSCISEGEDFSCEATAKL
ncbi:MAG TPA: hypothetical protein VLD40_01610 [Dissulfurispiraceae bacterium]|nr:hypothetical protein [Dissulfurispiraceae bacterium]